LDKALDKAVKEVQDYYHRQVRTVKAEHLLVRLLMSLGVPLKLPNQVYYDRVTDVAYRNAAAMYIPTPISRGTLFTKNTFYGENVFDVLAVVNEDHENIDELYNNWKWLEAIKLYRHPLVDLSLSIPDGKQPARVMGNCCVAIIDLPLLALQYKAWMEDNLRNRPENPLTIEHFIAMFVIPNMLPRQTDIAIANRIFASYQLNGALPAPERINPLSIPRYEHQLDVIVNEYLNRMKVNEVETFDQMLAAIPQLNDGGYHKLISVPPGPLTEPVGWVWLLAQLPTLEFLVKVNSLAGNQRNQSYLRDIRLALLDYTSARVLSRFMPEPLLTKTLFSIQHEILPYISQTK
jgi:hypothetical protein